MTDYVRAYSGDEGNTLVTVSTDLAKSAGLHTVKDAPLDERGRPLPPSEGYRKTSAKSAASTKTGGSDAASTPEEASK